jgi:excisionase family DNA binding protein
MRCIEDSDAFIETRDAARHLGVPVRELYDLIDTGRLPAYKAGRNIKLRQVDVDDFRRGRAAGN